MRLDEPPCWSSAFLRPSRWLRKAATRRLRGTCAAVHVRACSSIGWQDNCEPLADPYTAATTLRTCACPYDLAPRIYASSDSAALVDQLAMREGAAAASVGTPTHLNRLKPRVTNQAVMPLQLAAPGPMRRPLALCTCSVHGVRRMIAVGAPKLGRGGRRAGHAARWQCAAQESQPPPGGARASTLPEGES